MTGRARGLRKAIADIIAAGGKRKLDLEAIRRLFE
jgi:hypothetical protein